MKKDDLRLGHGSAWLGNKPASSARPKSIVGLDDDIFAPIKAQRAGGNGPLPLEPITSRPWSPLEESSSGDLNLQCFFQDAGLAASTASGDKFRLDAQLNSLPDNERQRFRELLAAALNRVGVLEKIVTEQSADLSLSRTQIADLCNEHKEQAAALQAAQAESARLNGSIATLQRTVSERDSEIAESKQKFDVVEGQRQALQAKLDEALKNTGDLSRRLLESNMLVNDKETALASVREQVDRLHDALAEAQAEKRALTGEIEEISHSHRGELADQRERFEELLGRIKVMISKRDHDIKRLEKIRVALTKRCDGLAKSIEVLKSSEQQLQAKIDSRTGAVGILESQLRTERDIAERRINELKIELQRARAEHAASERALEEMCRDITFLLPDLSAQLGRIGKPRLEVAASRMRAA